MTEASGVLTIAGFAREPVPNAPQWPAAAPALITRRLPLLTTQPSDGVVTALNDSTAQGYGPDSADVTALLPSDIWTLQLRYQGFEEIFAVALGYMAKRLSGVLQPEVVAPGVYRHLLEVDNTLSTATPWTSADGFVGGELTPALYRVRRGTAVLWRQVSVWEYLSAMVRKLTLTANLERVTCTVEFAPYALSRSSMVNTPTTVQATLPHSALNILFRQAVIRLGPYSTSVPLDTSHDQGSLNWSLELDNQLTAGAPGVRTGLAPEEFERQGPPVLTLALALPRYTSDQRFSDWRAGAQLMGSIQMTGPLIPGTATPYQLKLWFPALTLTQVSSPVQGATVANMTYQARLQVPVAQPAGFPVPHHLSPLQAEIVSGESRHPLLS